MARSPRLTIVLPPWSVASRRTNATDAQYYFTERQGPPWQRPPPRSSKYLEDNGRSSVLRHAGIDRPRIGGDAAAEVLGGREAGLLEQRERLGRADAGLAVDHHPLRLRQLGEPARQLAQGDQLRARDTVDLPLGRLAHVDQADRLAAVEQLLQLGRRQRRARRRGLGLVGDHPAELLVVDQLGDGGVLATDRALRVLADADVLEGQLQRVVDEQPSDQRVTDPRDELDRLVGLDRADGGAEHPEHAALGARRHHAGRGRLGVQAAVAGSVLGPEHARLTVEAVDRAPDVGLALEHAGVVDEVARGEVVRAVDHQVVGADDLAGVVRGQPGLVQGDLDVGVDLTDLVAGALQLGPADVGGAVDDLALQVGGVDLIEVHQADVAYSGRGQVHRVGRAEAAGADQQDVGLLQPLLAVHGHVGNDEMARVAEDLVPRELPRRLD